MKSCRNFGKHGLNSIRYAQVFELVSNIFKGNVEYTSQIAIFTP